MVIIAIIAVIISIIWKEDGEKIRSLSAMDRRLAVRASVESRKRFMDEESRYF